MSENWWVVFAAFLCLVFMFAVPTFMIPVLYSPIIDEFGWSRLQVSLFATVKFTAGALVGVMFGFLLDRTSIRKIVVASGTLSGIAMIAFLLIDSLVKFYAVGLALGIGAIGIMISMKVLVSRSFHERQGFALGMALLGTSVGGSLIRAITPNLLDAFGWRGAVAVMSGGTWFIALPLFLWLVKEDEQSDPAKQSADAADLSVVLRNRTFWMLGLAVVFIGFVDQALSQHFVVYLDKDIGFGLPLAARAASIATLISIGGKVGFGWLYDKLSVRGVMICYVLMAIAALIAIPVEGTILLGALLLTRGLAHGGAIVDIPVMAKHCFGPKLLGRTIGLLTAFVTVGFAAGPPIMGYLYDTQGTYRYAFMMLAGVAVAAALMLLAVKPVYWETHIRPLHEKENAPQTAEPAV
jgi:nitrate/nitrite transporter NarK